MEEKEKSILTYAQEMIRKLIHEKKHILVYDLPWGEYADYGDYNDCHGDYYDADYQ